MINKALVFLGILYSTLSFSQKVDLDRFYFNVAYQRLPQMNVDYEKRTFDVTASVLGPFANYFNPEGVASRIDIVGWKRTPELPTVKATLSLDDFAYVKNEVITRKVENKDKDGKVTSTSYYYSVKSWYNCKGSYVIDGPTPVVAAKTEKTEEKAPAKPANKFLSQLAPAAPITEAVNGSNKSAGKVRYLNNTLEDATAEKNSSGEAIREFNLNAQLIRDNKLKEFVNNSVNAVSNELTAYYGFPEYKTNDFFWILDSKDHPEYADQQAAIEAIKVLFKGMKGNEPVTTLESSLVPIIEYLNTLKTKYNGDDKRSKKMRYSAYYNLAKIYLYLDQPDKCITEAKGLIANDYDESDGEGFIKDATALKELFAKTHFTTRHNIPLK